jgi:hypothetical protein
MKIVFSVNKSNTILPKKQNIIKPQITEKEPVVSQSFNFFQKTPMFQQILLPYNCGNCGK